MGLGRPAQQSAAGGRAGAPLWRRLQRASLLLPRTHRNATAAVSRLSVRSLLLPFASTPLLLLLLFLLLLFVATASASPSHAPIAVDTHILEETPSGLPLPAGKTIPATPGALDELGLIVDGSPSAIRRATFAFYATVDGTRCAEATTAGYACAFECQLDFAGYQPCDPSNTSFDRLDDGEHAFYVRAAVTHPDGVTVTTDASPAYYYWTVYSHVETAIPAHPETYVAEGPFEFGFECNKPDASFEVQLDAQTSWTALDERVGEYSVADGALGEGAHTLRARCVVHDHPVSPGGLFKDASPAAHSFIVDRTDPQLEITGGPAHGSSALLNFTTLAISAVDLAPSGGPSGASGVARVECRLSKDDPTDASAPALLLPSPPLHDWETCSLPYHAVGLLSAGSGNLTFAARAVDRAGNVGPTALRTFFQNFDLPAPPRVSGLAHAANVTTLEDQLTRASDLVITPGRDPANAHGFAVSDVVGGELFLSDGSTQLSGGASVTLEEGAAGLRFRPRRDSFSGDARGSAFSFDVRGVTDDGEQGAAMRVTIHVVSVQDPLSFAEPRQYFALEQILSTDADFMDEGTGVLELLRYGVAFASADNLGMAIVGVDDSLGEWQYRVGGMYDDWVGVPEVTPNRALLLAADGATRLRFQPSRRKCRLVPEAQTASVTFHLWDRTDGFASGSFIVNTAEYDAEEYNASALVPYEDEDGNEVDELFYVDPTLATGAHGDGAGPYTAATGVANVRVGGLDAAATRRSDFEGSAREARAVAAAAGCPPGHGGALAISATPATETYRGLQRSADTRVSLQPPGYLLPDMSPPWTLEVWVRRTAALTANVLTASALGERHIDLEAAPGTGSPGFHVDGTTYSFDEYELPLSRWAHLAFVASVDGAAGPARTLLYADLELVGEVNTTLHLPLASLGAANMTSAFEVDDVRVWSEARTAVELDAYYDARLDGEVRARAPSRPRPGASLVTRHAKAPPPPSAPRAR